MTYSSATMPLPALVPVTPENTDLHLFVGASIHLLQSAKFKRHLIHVKGEVAYKSMCKWYTKVSNVNGTLSKDSKKSELVHCTNVKLNVAIIPKKCGTNK